MLTTRSTSFGGFQSTSIFLIVFSLPWASKCYPISIQFLHFFYTGNQELLSLTAIISHTKPIYGQTCSVL